MNKKTIAISLVTVLLITTAYLAGTFYYKNKLPKNIFINEENFENLTIEEINEKFASENKWENLTVVKDKEILLELNRENINYKYVESQDLVNIFESNNKWVWFKSILNPKYYTVKSDFEYDNYKIKELVDNMKEFDYKVKNAVLEYDEELEEFIVIPHNYEIKISKEDMLNKIFESIENTEQVLDVTPFIQNPEVSKDNPELLNAKSLTDKYMNVIIKYTYGDKEEIINKSLIKNWVVVQGNQVDLNSDKVREHIVMLAKKYDTHGKSREFKTTSGKTITTKGGAYGWMTHRAKTTNALIEYIKKGENITIEPVYSTKAISRNSNDIGNSYVEIDLSEQMVYVYSKGELKVKTPTVTGNVAQGHSTPKGVDPINYKTKNAVLRGADYASPVKYWMPFNGGVGLHDADWRSNFGGQIYKTNGSHGCINLPPNVAKSVYDLVYPGMPVIVY